MESKKRQEDPSDESKKKQLNEMQPKGILANPDTPRRAVDNTVRRISWGQRKVKEFKQISDPSDTKKQEEQKDDAKAGRRKSNTKWGPEETFILSPDLEHSSDKAMADFEEEDDSVTIDPEERK
jgi:hypothetical protein